MSVADYSRGMRHGREDLAKLISEILARDIPDAEKLQQIGWAVSPFTGGVVELPDEGIHDSNGDGFYPDEDAHDPRD